MVVLLDLEEDVSDPHTLVLQGGDFADLKNHLSNGAVIIGGKGADIDSESEKERENPNINGFSAALGCYP